MNVHPNDECGGVSSGQVSRFTQGRRIGLILMEGKWLENKNKQKKKKKKKKTFFIFFVFSFALSNILFRYAHYFIIVKCDRLV